jgi:hypothetical protein
VWTVDREEEEDTMGLKAKGSKVDCIPSKEEVEEHLRSGHVPYRSWCKHCIYGRGEDKAHHRGIGEEGGIPVISMDYCYLYENMAERKERKKEESEGKFREIMEMPIVVIKDRKSKQVMAELVPRKGVEKFAIERGHRIIDGLGYGEVVLKSDQEPSIMALKREIKERLRGTVKTEESPVGEHQSNGEIENAVGRVQGQYRSIKHWLEARIGEKIKGDSSIVAWMVRHSGNVINRYQVGFDGETAVKRGRGRDFKRDVAEFGEYVMYLRLESEGKDKGESRWGEGVFLGPKEESAEVIIGIDRGVVKARTFRRFGSEEERWRKEKVLELKGVPWELIPGDGRGDQNIGIDVGEQCTGRRAGRSRKKEKTRKLGRGESTYQKGMFRSMGCRQHVWDARM